MSPSAEGDELDWLRSLRADAGEGEIAGGGGQDEGMSFLPEQEAEEGEPDWLSRLNLGADETAGEQMGGGQRFEDQQLEQGEEWLQRHKPFDLDQSGLAQEEGGTVIPADGEMTERLEEQENLGNWFSAEPASQDGAAGISHEQPDWLSNIEIEQPAAADAESFGDEPQLFGGADVSGKDHHEGDWLADVEQYDEAVEKPVVSTSGVKPFLEEDLPDWLANYSVADESVSAGGVSQEGEQPSVPFEEGSFSNWLAESSDVEEAAPEVHTEEPSELSGIAEAQLPAWLQAMRPVEGLPAKPLEGGVVETAGPLAGLPAVIPTDSLAAYYRKPPVYSSKLRMSQRQQQQVELLEKMLEEGAKPLEVAPKKRYPYSQRIIRLIVGLGLILVVALIYLITPPGMLVGSLSPGEGMENFSAVVESLPADALVLVAMDFDPGLGGEMGLAAIPVLQRLIEKKARVALVSSSAGGVIMGEDLVRRAYEELGALDAERVGGYDLEKKVVNLGYLAGQTVSLQEFVTHPMRAARFGLYGLRDQKQVWDYPALQGHLSLTDFQAVIVVVDNMEAGRVWVEQVQPKMQGVPFLMVSSAQAAPLLLPYYESAQVQGMLVGMRDGLFYGQKWLMPGNRAGFWGAFQSGMLITIVLLLLGAIVQLAGALFTRNKTRQEG
ncbi:MAG: hypothetical protein HPY45_02605 [Anaerolineae bacterium]|nr:hypothetical protein [Anaerolineae bacterium]